MRPLVCPVILANPALAPGYPTQTTSCNDHMCGYHGAPDLVKCDSVDEAIPRAIDTAQAASCRIGGRED